MKKRILVLAAILTVCIANLSAQYCGTSGSSVCTPAGTVMRLDSFNSEVIPCAVRNTNNDITMHFLSTGYIFYNGIYIGVDSMRLDSIGALPSGMCWAASKASNTYRANEDGCIRFIGTTTAPVGQYKLRTFVTLFTNIGVIGPMLDTETFPFGNIYLRLKNYASSPCPLIDTTQQTPYDPGVNADSVAYITGTVYHDANQNGQQDNGEAGLKNILVNVGSMPAITNQTGHYSAYVMPGNTLVTPQGLENGAISFPSGSQTINAAQGQTYSGINFATIISPSYCDATLSVASISMPPRPGFDNTVRVTLTNSLSQSPMSITLRLTYDSVQTYVSSSQSLANQGPNYVEWNLSGLALGSTWYADVTLNTTLGTPLGKLIKYGVTSSNSSCPNLDLKVSEQTVIVGSYDPNDKAVSPIGFSDHHGINPNQVEELTYKIRFQNTGTFLAEKVVIVDTMSPNLDLTTLRVLSASHSYEVNIGDDRAVKFVFDQIMLPDSNSNEPESHGYIQYAIKLNENLAQNTQVTNKADIYFDFNEPIRTNTAYNTVDYTVVGIKEAADDYSLSLYPNPANGSVQVGVDERLLGSQLSLSDLSGRILLSAKIDRPTMQVDLGGFAKGVYLVRTGSTVKKLIKE